MNIVLNVYIVEKLAPPTCGSTSTIKSVVMQIQVCVPLAFDPRVSRASHPTIGGEPLV